MFELDVGVRHPFVKRGRLSFDQSSYMGSMKEVQTFQIVA
jgi:hypothetical protein